LIDGCALSGLHSRPLMPDRGRFPHAQCAAGDGAGGTETYESLHC